MLAHGGRRDPEELGDLGVRLAADDPGKDLALARGQAELFARLLEEQRVAGAIDRETAVTTLSSHRSRAHLQPVRECGWQPPAGLRCAPEVAEMGLEQIEHEPVAFREVSSRAPVEQERLRVPRR